MWRLWLLAVRVRCLGMFHRFDSVDTGDYSGYGEKEWYCQRCYVLDGDDEYVTSGPLMRLAWIIGGYRLWHRIASVTWRFER